MGNVKRIYVEKKAPYAVRAKELKSELRSYLGLKSLEEVRVLIRYDIENISEDTYKKALGTIFSEPLVDILYEEAFPADSKEGTACNEEPDSKKAAAAQNSRVFSVEYLPGQFDQRADSAEQCVKLLNETEEPVIRSATTYVLTGEISDEDFARVKEYCINPVDSRETNERKPETLFTVFDTPEEIGRASCRERV